MLARYGGEEFVILLADTSAEDAGLIAEQIRHRVEKTDFTIPSGKMIHATLSIGTATLAQHSHIHDTKSLVAAADQAVYAAKLSGRNQVKQAR